MVLKQSLDDVTSTLYKMDKDRQTKTFIQCPDVGDRRFYQTSPRLLDAPWTLPSNFDDLTKANAPDLRKSDWVISHAQGASLERVLAAGMEMSSWMDWWISSLTHWRSMLPVEELPVFDRYLRSGMRASSSWASHTANALSNLALCRRDFL